MGNHQTFKGLGLVALALSAAALAGACSNSSGGNTVVPPDVRSMIFLQREARTGTGNVFDYTSYVPGAKLLMLTPPAADGIPSAVA